MKTRESIAYPVLMVLGALDAAGYSVIAPVTPAIARATGAGPALIGALVASFPVGIMVGFLLAPPASRRDARQPSSSSPLAWSRSGRSVSWPGTHSRSTSRRVWAWGWAREG